MAAPMAADGGIGLPLHRDVWLRFACSYSLLGAAWLVMKTSDDLRDIAYRYSFRMALVTLGFAGLVSIWVPFQSPLVWDRWFTTPTFGT